MVAKKTRQPKRDVNFNELMAKITILNKKLVYLEKLLKLILTEKTENWEKPKP